MLYYNLGPIFKARGILKPNAFLVNAGISPRTAYKILNDDAYTFRLEHVELLCHLLVCEPNDLLAFKPDKDKHYAENHPLLSLGKQSAGDTSWQEAIATMPFKQLKEAAKNILQSVK